jgi:hypothetical protein
VNTRHWTRIIFVFVSILLFSCGTGPIDDGKETIYYAIEISGVLCGYAEFKVDTLEQDGQEAIHLDEHLFIMLKALGMEFDTDVKLTYHVDPETGQFTYHAVDVKQGQTEMSSEVFIEGDTARVTSTLRSGDKRIPLTPDVILENTLTQYHLLEDFVEGGLEEKTYDILETRGAEIQKATYTKTGTETMELAGKTYQAMLFDQLNHVTGLKIQLWIDTESGRVLKLIPIGNRVVYLSDRSVVKRIKTASVDDLILTEANVTIADIPSISYMKVKASIEPVGLWVTPEGLNVPGQSFVGTVEENVIEGVFEIEHPRYEGSSAPPFPPPDFHTDESLESFLKPSEFAQSDDAVLREKAKEITRGSADSWEATTRISRWVADNIGYAIPGGGTARKTYDMRAGECGAHSLLVVAFCRAVGIPARMVWGCMYAPQRGGSFGQHGWNEIYMGEAGWVPIDATAHETDFVDSGHIRIGAFHSPIISFNAHAMEILDYRLIGGDAAETGMEAKYDAYAGEYRGPRGETMTVSAQEGNLTLDIPNSMVLAFHDPDEEGKWVCTLSNRLYLTFKTKNSGEAGELWIHEVVHMPRTSDPEKIDDDVPEGFKSYLGVYHYAARQADFTVSFKRGKLTLYDPLERTTVKFQGPDDKGRWLDEYDKNTISFERDDKGNVTTLVVDATSKCPRK